MTEPREKFAPPPNKLLPQNGLFLSQKIKSLLARKNCFLRQIEGFERPEKRFRTYAIVRSADYFAQKFADAPSRLRTIPQITINDAEKSQVISAESLEYGFCYLTGAPF